MYVLHPSASLQKETTKLQAAMVSNAAASLLWWKPYLNIYIKIT